MFPMLPQGFSFLKNLFERLCSTSSVHWKKHHSVYKQKMNEFLFAKEMHGSVLNEFWQVFCLICTVYLEGWAVYCENGPFPCFPMTVWILSSDNLLSFLVHSNESDCFFHSAAAVATLLEGRLMKKTIRFVFRSPENSKGCLIRESKQSLLSKEMVHFHSALLNLPGSQCKQQKTRQNSLRTEPCISLAHANSFLFYFFTEIYYFVIAFPHWKAVSSSADCLHISN